MRLNLAESAAPGYMDSQPRITNMSYKPIATNRGRHWMRLVPKPRQPLVKVPKNDYEASSTSTHGYTHIAKSAPQLLETATRIHSQCLSTASGAKAQAWSKSSRYQVCGLLLSSILLPSTPAVSESHHGYFQESLLDIVLRA